MRVTVIVPIYKGNQFVNGLIDMIEENREYIKKCGQNVEVELLLINDYPDIPIEAGQLKPSTDFTIKVISNPTNQGIHQTRVNGLLQASGEYVLMLDQDDLISANCISSQCLAIGSSDIVVGNGYKMFGERKKTIYRDRKKQQLSTKEKIYLYAANQIVSPGQCLIRKDAIPQEWYTYIIKKNGGDDFFLWILMFERNRTFAVNRKKIYTHIDTGLNLSQDLDKMYISSDNVIEMLKKCKNISDQKIHIYERRINFLRSMQTTSIRKKIIACILNLDICLYKIYSYYV